MGPFYLSLIPKPTVRVGGLDKAKGTNLNLPHAVITYRLLKQFDFYSSQGSFLIWEARQYVHFF
jgi:hypothetical protein